MHKQKRKTNRARVIGIILLIVSLVSIVMALFGPKFSPLTLLLLMWFGFIGVFISIFIINVPDTRNNEISKEILNHFDATHKD